MRTCYAEEAVHGLGFTGLKVAVCEHRRVSYGLSHGRSTTGADAAPRVTMTMLSAEHSYALLPAIYLEGHVTPDDMPRYYWETLIRLGGAEAIMAAAEDIHTGAEQQGREDMQRQLCRLIGAKYEGNG